jgi:MSHA biogenesis protein MshP
MNIEARKHSHGFILITVLFLLAVLAVMAVVMSITSSVQSFTTVYSLEQARGFAAAKSGLEYGIQRAVVPPGAGVCTNGGIVLPGINFTVTISCVSVPGINEAGNITEVYQISSKATTGALGNVGYVTRTVRATVNSL